MKKVMVVNSDMTVAEIVEVAKSHGIKGYSRFNKAQLIEYVNSNLPCDVVVEDEPIVSDAPIIGGHGSESFLEVRYDGRYATEMRVFKADVDEDALVTEHPIFSQKHTRGLPRTITFTDGTVFQVAVIRVAWSRKAVHELSTGVRLAVSEEGETTQELLERVALEIDGRTDKALKMGYYGIIDERFEPKIEGEENMTKFEKVVETLTENGYELDSYEEDVYEVTHTVNEIWALGYDSTELYITLYGGALTGKLEIELLGHYEGMEEITSCEVQLSDDNCDVQALKIIDDIFEEYDARHHEDDEEEEYLDYGEVTNEFMQEVLESSEYAYIFEGTLNDEYIGELNNEGRLHYGYAYYITTVVPVNEYQSKQTIFFTNNINAVNNQLNLKALLYKVDDVEEFITFF